MRNFVKSSVLAALCAGAAIVALPIDSRAGVMSVADRAIVSPSSSFDQIHYRRYYHRHYYRPYFHRHYYRHYHYRHYSYYPYGYGYYPYGYYPAYNPAGAVAGAAVGLATAPLWAVTGYPYGYGGPWWW